jgi:WASH complex subunit strumpellin
VDEFERKLEELDHTLSGFRLSFEYISDYVSIYGLKIWQEELTRIINFNVEQECNVFQRKKTYEWQSRFQTEAIPIPLFPPVDDHSVTFMGRLVRELLLQTDRASTTFFDSHSGWLDGGGNEVVGTRTFSLLHRSIGTAGLRGVDRTLGFLIMRDLNDVLRFYKRQVGGGLKALQQHMHAELNPTSTLPALADKMYKAALERTSKLWPWFAQGLSRVGQAQLLRRNVAAQLNFACKLDSPTLSSALEVMNEAVLSDISAHYRDPENHPYPSESKGLLPQLTPYLDTLGLSCPMLKVYTATEGTEGMAMIMCLFVVSQMPLYKYDTRLRLLMPLPRSYTHTHTHTHTNTHTHLYIYKAGAVDGTTVVIPDVAQAVLFN